MPEVLFDKQRGTHYIRLTLSTSGYTADDVGLALPEFMTERSTTVGLTWWPPAHGPEFYTLLVVASGMATAALSSFFSELGKDLYAWAKRRLNQVLSSKRYPVGQITLRTDGCELVAFAEGATQVDEPLLALVALAACRPSDAVGTYDVHFDAVTDSWVAAPTQEETGAHGRAFVARRTDVLALRTGDAGHQPAGG
jgi:hypothetical protein